MENRSRSQSGSLIVVVTVCKMFVGKNRRLEAVLRRGLVEEREREFRLQEKQS